MTTSPLAEQLATLGMRHSAAHIDDLVATATNKRLAPAETIEMLVEHEARHRAKRSLERRLARSRIGRFKPMADYEWDWPKRIDATQSRRRYASSFSRVPATSCSSRPRASARP
jgi:hypothetical protein